MQRKIDKMGNDAESIAWIRVKIGRETRNTCRNVGNEMLEMKNERIIIKLYPSFGTLECKGGGGHIPFVQIN